MGDRHSKLDVAHALATNTRESHFNTTTVTDHALMFDTLVFSTGTLPVTGWTEDTLTEETTFFRFEGSVIDCLWVQHFTAGPRTNGFWRRHSNSDMIELLGLVIDPEEFTQVSFNAHDNSFMF